MKRLVSAAEARRRDEGGFMLALVLGIVLFLSIAGIAILGLVDTTSRATASYSETADALREIDGALETAVQKVRHDDTACILGAPIDIQPPQPLKVICDPYVPPTGPVSGVRTMDLTVERPGVAGIIGHARVRIVDVVNAVDVIGFSLEVCDWLLGRTDVTQPLKGCST